LVNGRTVRRTGRFEEWLRLQFPLTLEAAASYRRAGYGLAKATGSEKLLTGEPGRVFRGQKDSDGGDVARLADAAERSLRDGGLLEFRSDDAAAVGAFRLDHAGIDAVDSDLLRAELAGERSGDGVDRALGAGVNRGAIPLTNFNLNQGGGQNRFDRLLLERESRRCDLCVIPANTWFSRQAQF
jgi:hypothetical protein